MNGWFRFYRVTLEGPLQACSPGQRWVFVACLANANIKAAQWFDGRDLIDIPVGSFITTEEHLAEKANVTRSVVRRALKNLGRIGLIRAQGRAKRWTRIEIVNWDSYYGPGGTASQDVSPAQSHPAPTASPYVRRKEGRPEEGSTHAPRPESGKTDEEFAQFWSLYPRKAGKQAAQTVWRHLMPDEAVRQRILGALRTQKDSDAWKAEGGRFVPYPERWLKGRRWEDEVPSASHTDARRLNDAWKDVQPGEVKL